MDHLSYKALHENFTSNNNGSTALETFMVVLPSLLGSLVITGIQPLLEIPNSCDDHYRFTVFSLEYICMILPAMLSFTVLSNHLFILSLTVLIMWWSMLCYHSVVTHGNLHTFYKMFKEKYWKRFLSTRFISKQRPYITNFRSFTNMLTVLCILAVDFQIFPRRFAKTETFGYGIMDIGVGLFVVSNALVSPEGRPGVPPSTSFYKLFINNLPLLFLGFVRLGTTSFLGYQEHVTEYGTHWNFFFTLAATKTIGGFLMRFIKGQKRDYMLLSGILVIFYEIILNVGLRDWIFSDTPRLTVISANREGFASIVGYIALYFSGVLIRKILNERDKLTGNSNILLIIYLCSWACILWMLTMLCGSTVGVSRRLANLGYFLWVLSFSVTFIAFFVFCESVTCLQNIIFSSCNKAVLTYPPVLCEAINYNGLLFFLLGNVLTGIINLSIRTLFLDWFESLLIIAIYMFVNCGVVTMLYLRKIHMIK